MALTLIESIKYLDPGMPSSGLTKGIIEVFAKSSPFLAALPFVPCPEGVYKYSQEDTLPGIGFRGINEAYDESTGIINPQYESLVIAGGDLDVDTFLVANNGIGLRSVQESMKAKALALKVTKYLLEGDSATDPRVPDGLKKRITGNQLISAGSTANGAALSLAKLDEVIDAVEGCNVLAMSKAMLRRLGAAARNYTVAGDIAYTLDSFGARATSYNGIPILQVGRDELNAEILAFDEAAASGTATATSIFALNMSEGYYFGIQNGLVSARDLGELETKPVYRTRVEWFIGQVVAHPLAAARLYQIGDVAVVA